jgi:hypothetical protein
VAYPVGVKTSKAQDDQMFSGLPPKSDMAARFMSTRRYGALPSAEDDRLDIAHETVE